MKRLDIDTSAKLAVITPSARAGEVQTTLPDYAEIIRRPSPVDENEARIAEARARLELDRGLKQVVPKAGLEPAWP